MAMGIYVGAGGVKTVNAIRVGAGGVKTVNAVYVGAGGVKQVWPATYTITGTMSTSYWECHWGSGGSSNIGKTDNITSTTQNGLSCLTWNYQSSDSSTWTHMYQDSSINFYTKNKYDLSSINYLALEVSADIVDYYDVNFASIRIGIWTDSYIESTGYYGTATRANYCGYTSAGETSGPSTGINGGSTGTYCYLVNISSINVSAYIQLQFFLNLYPSNSSVQSGYGYSHAWYAYFYDCLAGNTSTASDYGGDFSSKGFRATITVS